MRIGHGYDAHAFTPGRRFVLGGVEIEHDQGLAGHSDADVLTHALIDALLGSVAMGDLGSHFPSADGRFKDADSFDLLRQTLDLIKAKGALPTQVDGTLVIERPRIAPYLPAMREKLSRALGVELDSVSIKATTNDGMGWIGRGEGVAAFVLAVTSMPGETD